MICSPTFDLIDSIEDEAHAEQVEEDIAEDATTIVEDLPADLLRSEVAIDNKEEVQEIILQGEEINHNNNRKPNNNKQMLA